MIAGGYVSQEEKNKMEGGGGRISNNKMNFYKHFVLQNTHL
jgi:hypothetical protein